MKLVHLRIKVLVILLALFVSSCSLVGIHKNVYNPKKAGSYPPETRQMLLLGASTVYRTCYDVTHYDLHVTVDPAKKFISGKVIIAAVATSDFDTLQIDLFKNMNVKRIESNQKELVYKREEGAVFIAMHQFKNQKFELTIDYDGNPVVAKRPPWDGGFVWKKHENKPWIGVACETEGASLWWPCKDLVSDEPDSADVFITVPGQLMAVSNGVLKETTTNSDKTTYHWHTSYPINTYDVTLYIGDLKLLQDTYVSKVTGKTTALNHYVHPENYEKAQSHFQQLKPILDFYENKFGPYPWQRDGFKLVESPYEGMEHQSAIAYGNGYKNDFKLFDYIILHETAHEWWGNSVSAADLADGWIHEGFASYCEALYVEQLSGKQAYLNYMYFQRLMIKNKLPVVRKHNIRYFDYHDEDIYTKGSWILHTLRNTINDDSLFFDILKTFCMENNQKQILSDEFIKLVNAKTGKDYNWFFKQYLYDRRAPFLEFYWEGSDFYYRWVDTDTDFKLPVEIKIDEKIIVLHPTTQVQKITIETPGKTFANDSRKLYYGLRRNKELKQLFKHNP